MQADYPALRARARYCLEEKIKEICETSLTNAKTKSIQTKLRRGERQRERVRAKQKIYLVEARLHEAFAARDLSVFHRLHSFHSL